MPQLKIDHGTTFEEAVELIGFGKFNYMLIMMIITGSMSTMFESTSMSYIFAPAQCDLNLSLQDKGLLNSITYAGMISSAFVWGMLLDKFGRKKLMVYGYLLDAICMFMTGFSQNLGMLIVFKFLGGLIINGPFAAMIAYLGELHSSAYRSKIQLINGAFLSFGQILCPVLAWLILPMAIKWSLFNGFIELHSWNIYIITMGLSPLASGIIFMFLPESPKFLMTSGENEKALKVLQNIYSKNTGNPPQAYVVKELYVEKKKSKETNESLMKKFCNPFQLLGPLFKPPYIFKLTLVTIIQVLFIMGLNSLRLWSPQLFQAIEDYKLFNNGTTTDLCTMIEVLQPNPTNNICSTNINSQVYVNSLLVSTFGLIGFFICAAVINKVGKKVALVILSWTAGICGCCLYFARGTNSTTALISIFITCCNISGTLILTVGVEMFPTNWRAFVISLIMAIARIGAVVGNLIFPTLLSLGCASTFLSVGSTIAVGGFLVLFLPNTEKKALV